MARRKEEIRPNFFVVGAPKSGTTALYSYLKRNPEILMSRIKEPQFFAADVCGNQRRIRSLSDYLSCFEACPEKNVIGVGEASTCYLVSKQAPFEIKDFCPKARIIVMLRNPIEVMYAVHSERVFGGIEHIVDFRTALESSEVRKWRSGPFKGNTVKLPGYRELTKFSEQIARYFEIFGRENVHITLYDDFARDSKLAFRSVASFLGLVEDQATDFGIVNANRRVRSSMFQDLLRHPPNLVKRFTRKIFPEVKRREYGNFLRSLNVKLGPRPPLEQKFQRQLEVEYENETYLLGRLLNRDLRSLWAGSGR